MKFIHLTDTHITGGAEPLNGKAPISQLNKAIESINTEHGDAEFVILTGDITHWGHEDAYLAFRDAVQALDMPIHLMVGNHDDTPALTKLFPNTERDMNGFVQKVLDVPLGRFVLMDTKTDGSHAGSYCADRRAWLRARCEEVDTPLYLFMHHPPFDVGIAAMDKIKLLDAEEFYEVIAPFTSRIRHIFFGHVHRAIFGNWCGISYSCMRGLNHQVALGFEGPADRIKGNFESPAYGVVLLSDDQVTIHMHCYEEDLERFFL